MCNVLVIKSWLGSKNDVFCVVVDEVMVLVLVVVRVVRDVVLYVDVMVVENEEVLLELDKLSLERVRLNDMEYLFWVGYVVEDVMLEVELSYV